MTRNTRKRIGVYGTLGVAVLLFMLHPYAWQTVFGPRICGLPLAYRQDQYRQAAAPVDSGSPLVWKLLAVVGVRRASRLAELDHDAAMIPVMLSLVDDPDWHIRAAVARSLALHPASEDACDGVMRLTEDGSRSVRAHAIAGLTSIARGFAPALPRLQQLLGDDDPLCQVAAAYGVCKISGQADMQAVAIYRSALKTEDWGRSTVLCRDAARGLCRLGKDNPEFLQILIDGLPTNAKTRHLGVFHLRDAGPAAIPVLVGLLEDQNPETREAAAGTLSSIDPVRFPRPTRLPLKAQLK